MAARETVTSGDNMERYFKRVDSPFLPAEHGELSKVVPSKSIKEANKPRNRYCQRRAVEKGRSIRKCPRR